jgi:hypothetical protein
MSNKLIDLKEFFVKKKEDRDLKIHNTVVMCNLLRNCIEHLFPHRNTKEIKDSIFQLQKSLWQLKKLLPKDEDDFTI